MQEIAALFLVLVWRFEGTVPTGSGMGAEPEQAVSSCYTSHHRTPYNRKADVGPSIMAIRQGSGIAGLLAGLSVHRTKQGGNKKGDEEAHLYTDISVFAFSDLSNYV